MRFGIAILSSFVLLCPATHASSHGPVFGFATPVNSKGEFSFDTGIFGRNAPGASLLAVKSMVSYGITPQLQVSVVAPGLAQQGPLPMSMMAGGEFQGNLAWRFHHQPNAVGQRFESTASAGVVVPGPQDNAGMYRGFHNAPGITGWIATGVASRSHYLWVGAGGMHFASRGGDQRPNVVSASLVYGYRPPAWRADTMKWDCRFFGELTGEHDGLMQRAGFAVPGSDANQVFAGPTFLAIRNSFAISGGVQARLYSAAGGMYPRERLRFAVNVSYFLFSGHTH